MKRRNGLLVVAFLNFMVAGFLLLLAFSKGRTADGHAAPIDEIDLKLAPMKKELAKRSAQADKPLTVEIDGETRTIPSTDSGLFELKSEIYPFEREKQFEQRSYNSANKLSALAWKYALGVVGVGVFMAWLYSHFKKPDPPVVAGNSPAASPPDNA